MSITKDVAEVTKIHVSGNIIPANWYKVLSYSTEKKDSRPHLLAINLLADIRYWYTATEVRNEATGKVTGHKKKFAGDLLQRDYPQISAFFGVSEPVAKDAVLYLEKIGVICRLFKQTRFTGGCTRVMYIKIFPEVLEAINDESEPLNIVKCKNSYSTPGVIPWVHHSNYYTPPKELLHPTQVNTPNTYTTTDTSSDNTTSFLEKSKDFSKDEKIEKPEIQNLEEFSKNENLNESESFALSVFSEKEKEKKFGEKKKKISMELYSIYSEIESVYLMELPAQPAASWILKKIREDGKEKVKAIFQRIEKWATEENPELAKQRKSVTGLYTKFSKGFVSPHVLEMSKRWRDEFKTRFNSPLSESPPLLKKLKSISEKIKISLEASGIEKTAENILKSFEIIIDNLPKEYSEVKGFNINFLEYGYDKIIAVVKQKGYTPEPIDPDERLW